MGFVRSTLSLAIRSALPLATERTQERDARIISGIESTILVVVVNLFSAHNVPIVPLYHRTIWFSAIHRNIAENVNLIFILYIIIYYNYIIYSNFFFLRVQNRFS